MDALTGRIITDGVLTVTQKLTLLAAYSVADGEGRFFIDEAAEVLGVGRGTVRAHMRILEALGVVSTLEKGTQSSSTIYQITKPLWEMKDDTHL